MGKIKTIERMSSSELAKLFSQKIIIEEKVDGSYFVFGKDEDGKMYFKSKQRIIDPNNSKDMFTEGIESILSIQDKIPKGYRFFGEYLNKPKHNVLKYNRVPDKNVILWDVFDNYRMSHCLWAPDMKEFIRNMGLEIVPILYKGNPPIDLEASFNLFSPFLSSESCLGGQKVEGIVVKTIGQTRYLGKFVNSSFKEVHCKRKSNELQSIRREGILPSLIRELKTESRWVKAVQHLRENGSLNGDLSDIKNICKEIGGDVKCEEGDYIKRQLFKWAWPEISKGILKGVPEWYKESLDG